jgi:hypothetical protein
MRLVPAQTAEAEELEAAGADKEDIKSLGLI